MTRFSLTLSTIVMGVAASMAAPLTPSQALSRAATATSPTAKTAATARFTATDLIYTGTFSARDASPAYYIFSRPGEGFLIVGGDDVAAPVLGYSATGSFSAVDMPDNLRWWLSEYSAAIAAASRNANGTKTFPLNARRPERAPIAPIVKTKWNQDEPYNLKCPTENDEHTYTGCVATAMAQVMKAHNWPDVGVGEHSYDWKGQTLSMNFAETPFDWNNMLDSYTPYTTDAQKQAVATLMSACGISVDMQYGPNFSYSALFLVSKALRKYFKYSVKTTSIRRINLTDSAWEDFIYNSLKNGAPVLYSGCPDYELAGHAFICDGYDTNGYFHFNWGWGGWCDGYFLLSGLDPYSLLSYTALTYNYNIDHECIINALPAKADDLGMIVLISSEVSYTLNEDLGTIDVKGIFTNCCEAPRKLQMGVACINTDGDTTIFQAPEISLSGGGWDHNIYGYSAGLPYNKLKDGIYTIVPVVNVLREAGTPLWQPVYCHVSDANMAYLTVENGNYTINMPQYKLVQATNVQTLTPFYKWQPFLVTFSLTNPNPTESYDLIYIGLTNDTVIYEYSLPMAVTLQPGETKTITYQGYFNSAPCGSYKLSVLNNRYEGTKCQLNQNPPTVTLEISPNTTFEVTDFSIQNPDAVNCSDMNFNVGIKCTNGYLYWPLIVHIYNDRGVNLGYQKTDNFLLEANQSKTQVVNISIPTLEPETEYTAILRYSTNTVDDMLQRYRFKVKTNSVSSIEATTGLNLYPGLVENSATLISEYPIRDVEVYSLDGRLQAVTVDGDTQNMTVNAAELPSGLYLMKVATSKGAATIKFVKK